MKKIALALLSAAILATPPADAMSIGEMAKKTGRFAVLCVRVPVQIVTRVTWHSAQSTSDLLEDVAGVLWTMDEKMNYIPTPEVDETGEDVEWN